MKKKVSKRKYKKQIKIMMLVVSLLLVFFSLLFDVFLGVVDILPTKYFLAIFIGTNLFVFLFVSIMVKRKFKLWIKFVCVFFSIILMFIFIVGCIYINKTYDFIGKIQAKDVIKENYYIYVDKNSDYKSIEDLKSKKIGTYNEKIEIYEKAIELLKQEIEVELVEYDSITEMVDSLIAEEIDGIFISSYHKDILTEEMDGFENLTTEIYKIESSVKNTSSIEHAKVNVTNETFNIYVSGIDQYGDISTRSRSDVNMIITVNPKSHEILLTSIPRDYYVQLHGTTGSKDKLTHAGVYGVEMSLTTLEDLFNIDIDYYFRVNFTSLVNVVDTIGGIDVYSDKGFVPLNYKHLYINQGVNHMNGEMALAFVRERYAYREGDRHRVQNQQDVLSAIIKKMSSSTTLLRKYTTLLDKLSSSFETNINMRDLTKLIKIQIDKMPTWTIKKYSVNGSDAMRETYSAGSQKLYVMIPDQATVDQATNYILGMEEGKTFAELGIE